MRDLIRDDKELQRVTLEEKLLKALASDSIRIKPQELEGRSIVALLREKLSARTESDTSE